MKTVIKDNNSLRCGMVLTCQNGSKYVVVCDDNGHHDVISLTGDRPYSNGIEVGTGKIAVCGGTSKGSRDVVKIEEFDAVPARNRLSEALKIREGLPSTEVLVTVWTAEDPAVTAAKAAVKAAEDALNDAKRRLADLA